MIDLIYGVVDMGSNTMRLSIYECANAEVKPLLSKKRDGRAVRLCAGRHSDK